MLMCQIRTFCLPRYRGECTRGYATPYRVSLIPDDVIISGAIYDVDTGSMTVVEL